MRRAGFALIGLTREFRKTA